MEYMFLLERERKRDRENKRMSEIPDMVVSKPFGNLAQWNFEMTDYSLAAISLKLHERPPTRPGRLNLVNPENYES